MKEGGRQRGRDRGGEGRGEGRGRGKAGIKNRAFRYNVYLAKPFIST